MPVRNRRKCREYEHRYRKSPHGKAMRRALLYGGGKTDFSPSLDRRDNSLGYVPGNVEVISWRANCLKRDATFAELAALGKRAQKINRGRWK